MGFKSTAKDQIRETSERIIYCEHISLRRRIQHLIFNKCYALIPLSTVGALLGVAITALVLLACQLLHIPVEGFVLYKWLQFSAWIGGKVGFEAIVGWVVVVAAGVFAAVRIHYLKIRRRLTNASINT
jgi:hypothetical protein